MPIYEYECASCHHQFEKKQKFSDAPVAKCPRCKTQSNRIIRSVPVIFKGSGFYVTDSRSSTGAAGSAGKTPDTSKISDTSKID